MISIALMAVVGLYAWRLRPVAPDAMRQARERARTPNEMVYVPGGDCLIGSDDPDAEEDERPMHRVFVPSFYIDRTEVTNTEFRRFRSSYVFPKGEDNLPVTNVTYDDAAAYAQWAGKRLPTEEEWEKAARGTDGRRYPWGNVWDPHRVAAKAHRHNAAPEPLLRLQPGRSCPIGSASRVQPVGSIPDGVSPYGCVDMAGNAWEWVQGYVNGNPNQRIIRGGAVGYAEYACRTYSRGIEGAGVT